MKKKTKISISTKAAEAKRREDEIKAHGKLVSLRPSIVHANKKAYKRNKRVDLDL